MPILNRGQLRQGGAKRILEQRKKELLGGMRPAGGGPPDDEPEDEEEQGIDFNLHPTVEEGTIEQFPVEGGAGDVGNTEQNLEHARELYNSAVHAIQTLIAEPTFNNVMAANMRSNMYHQFVVQTQLVIPEVTQSLNAWFHQIMVPQPPAPQPIARARGDEPEDEDDADAQGQVGFGLTGGVDLGQLSLKELTKRFNDLGLEERWNEMNEAQKEVTGRKAAFVKTKRNLIEFINTGTLTRFQQAMAGAKEDEEEEVAEAGDEAEVPKQKSSLTDLFLTKQGVLKPASYLTATIREMLGKTRGKLLKEGDKNAVMRALGRSFAKDYINRLLGSADREYTEFNIPETLERFEEYPIDFIKEIMDDDDIGEGEMTVPPEDLAEYLIGESEGYQSFLDVLKKANEFVNKLQSASKDTENKYLKEFYEAASSRMDDTARGYLNPSRYFRISYSGWERDENYDEDDDEQSPTYMPQGLTISDRQTNEWYERLALEEPNSKYVKRDLEKIIRFAIRLPDIESPEDLAVDENFEQIPASVGVKDDYTGFVDSDGDTIIDWEQEEDEEDVGAGLTGGGNEDDAYVEKVMEDLDTLARFKREARAALHKYYNTKDTKIRRRLALVLRNIKRSHDKIVKSYGRQAKLYRMTPLNIYTADDDISSKWFLNDDDLTPEDLATMNIEPATGKVDKVTGEAAQAAIRNFEEVKEEGLRLYRRFRDLAESDDAGAQRQKLLNTATRVFTLLKVEEQELRLKLATDAFQRQQLEQKLRKYRRQLEDIMMKEKGATDYEMEEIAANVMRKEMKRIEEEKTPRRGRESRLRREYTPPGSPVWSPAVSRAASPLPGIRRSASPPPESPPAVEETRRPLGPIRQTRRAASPPPAVEETRRPLGPIRQTRRAASPSGQVKEQRKSKLGPIKKSSSKGKRSTRPKKKKESKYPPDEYIDNASPDELEALIREIPGAERERAMGTNELRELLKSYYAMLREDE